MTEREAMILAFMERICPPEGSKYAIEKPWRDGDFLYATDGRIAAKWRTPLTTTDGRIFEEPVAGRKWPPINDVMVGDWEQGVSGISCAPVSTEECGECCGTGYVSCNLGHEHECPACLDGRVETNEAVFIERFPSLGRKYVYAIVACGGVLYPRKDGNKERAVRFTIGDDVEGVLMPRRDKPDAVEMAERSKA